MKKIVIKRILTKLNLLPFVEQINFQRQKIKNRKINQQFKQRNPNVNLPPDFYIYETFQLNYEKFYTEGIPTAKWIIDHVSDFKNVINISILDWGCGTGRILRHLPSIAGSSNTYYGCDYNEKYVEWCSENLNGINFKLNHLLPPLPYTNSQFDLIYGISIFTHLSKEQHYKWFNELYRVLKPEGILFITTHGDCHSYKLTKQELLQYKQGKLVVHDFKKEGNRLYSTYQPKAFMEEIVTKTKLKVLKHIPGNFKNNKPQQDLWILKK